jgi:hypothetical protein
VSGKGVGFWGLFVIGLACAGPSGGAADGGAVDAPADTLPSWCCKVDEIPTCSCRQIGGTRSETGMCPSICDAVPIVEERFVDQNGCPTIRLSSRSCLQPPDAPRAP